LADGGWSVPSQSVSDQCQLVIPAAASCSCNLKCSYCRCCPHLYQCSCLDFAVHATVCKHVHTLHELRGATYTNNKEVVDNVVTDPLPSPSSVVADEPSSAAIPCEFGQEEMSNGASDEQTIKKIVRQCREISAIATSGNLNRETLLAVDKQITAIKTTVKATATVSANFKCKPLIVTRRLPANKKLDKQFRFHSVRAKRRLALHRLRKPTASQLMAVKTTLLRRTAGCNEDVEPCALSAEGCMSSPLPRCLCDYVFSVHVLPLPYDASLVLSTVWSPL
jgi:hypothetical protein